MLTQTISFSMFCDAFRDMDRNENFSYQAKRILFDYLDETEDNIEFDVIAICCEFYENDIETCIQEYSIDVSDAIDEEDKNEIVKEYLQGNTLYLGETPSGFVYAAF